MSSTSDLEMFTGTKVSSGVVNAVGCEGEGCAEEEPLSQPDHVVAEESQQGDDAQLQVSHN